jgi:hypothetical protein
MKIKIVALILQLSISAPAYASTAQVESRNWSRGVFVFGDVLFDFGRGLFRAGVFRSTLEDCSDAQFFCARSDHASVVAPRFCEDLSIGSGWSLAGVTTRVIDQVEKPLGHLGVPGAQWYILWSDTTPQTAFVYSESWGVQALLFDPNMQMDFRGMAENGELGDFVTKAARGDGTARAFYMPLVTSDAFAGCQTKSPNS